MADDIIQTNNLSQTFQALKNKDPLKVERQVVENHPDYKRIPRSNYAPTVSVNTGSWGNGMARFASSGSTIYGQPTFFSPVHTPINWQIPSKRLEIYQWLIINGDLLSDDYTYKSIKEFEVKGAITEDAITGGIMWENPEIEKIISGNGNIKNPSKWAERQCEEKSAFEFSAIGNYHNFSVSEEHGIYVLDGKWLRKKRKVENNKKYRSNKGIIPNGVCKVKIPNNLIIKKDAKDISLDDYLITPTIPFKNEGEQSSKNLNMAYMIGLCAADGCIKTDSCVTVTSHIEDIHISFIEKIISDIFKGKCVCKNGVHDSCENSNISVISGNKVGKKFSEYITGKHTNKKFTKDIFNLSEQEVLNVLGGYFDGDGSYNPTENKIVANNYSEDMANQIWWMLIKCGINAGICKYPITGEHYPTSSTHYYRIFIPSSDVNKISPYMKSCKVPSNFIPDPKRELKFFYEADGIRYFCQPIKEIRNFKYSGTGYDMQIDPERSYVLSGFTVSNCRFFYENEPKVAASIDFYSQFPMSDWEHECKNREVKLYFDRFKKRLKLPKWCRLISHEVHLLGDCFPFIEVECEHCGGSGKIGSDICEHEGGTLKRIVILNPDYVDIHTPPLNPDPIISLRPDEELINMIQKKMPGYEKLSLEVRKLVSAGQPIRLDNHSVSHLKYGECGYQKYGISMVRRLFPILSYKTKLMVAQWIVAERLIIPIKVVKVGSDDRPAGPADIAAVQAQLSETANDPNVTIVTHNAFEIDWVGACYSNDTEVLTENGWKKYEDVSKLFDEKIATYNLDLNRIEYQFPQEYHQYDYTGEMHSFESKHYDVCVTPNHRMLVQEREWNSEKNKYKHSSWKVQRADKIIENSRFKTTSNWIGSTPDVFPYKSEYLLNNLEVEDYLKFVGYYVSEGGLKIDNGSINALHVTQKQDSPCFDSIRDNIYKVSSKIQESEDTRSDPSCWQFIVNDSKFAREIAGTYGDHSDSKRIPRWILNLKKDNLRILLNAMMEGDGNVRTDKNGKIRYKYTTVSKELADNVQEMVFKLGYDPKVFLRKSYGENIKDLYIVYWSEGVKENNFRSVKERNIKKVAYDGKVWCFTVPNGFFVTRRNGKIAIHGNSGKVLTLSNELEFINQEILDGMMINNALLNGEGPAFASAAVGIESMIQRLSTFRTTITEWLEEYIYIPEAYRQGFIDKNAETGEDEILIPKIKWNSMHLRDQQNYRQSVMQLYEKGLLSAQTVLEVFDFDPDQEIERKRYDALQMAALGKGMGGQDGGGGGMGGGGGGMGGLPPPMGGGAEGGAPIGAPGAEGGGMEGGGGAPAGGAPAISKSSSIVAEVADPSQFGNKILKKRTREQILSEQEQRQNDIVKKQQQQQKQIQDAQGGGTQRDEKGRIIFTKAERDLMPYLLRAKKDGLFGNDGFTTQFRVSAGDSEYLLDFAFPTLKIGVEADGEIFHSSPKQVTHDKERDMLLAQQGWTILRFLDTEIERSPQQIIQQVIKTVMQKQLTVKNLTQEKR